MIDKKKLRGIICSSRKSVLLLIEELETRYWYQVYSNLIQSYVQNLICDLTFNINIYIDPYINISVIGFFSFFVLFPQLPLRHLSNTAIDEKRINQSHSQYIILLPTLGETNFREWFPFFSLLLWFIHVDTMADVHTISYVCNSNMGIFGDYTSFQIRVGHRSNFVDLDNEIYPQQHLVFG